MGAALPLLTMLSLEGYRAIPPGSPVTLRLRLFTLILGPNSVSKSSILEAAAKAFKLEPLGTVEDTYKGLGGTVRLEAIVIG